MGFEHFRMGKAGAPFRHTPGTTRTRRADASTVDPKCATGGFYSSPALGSTVDSLSPLNVTWDSSLNCFPGPPSLVDVYLYAPGAALPIMHKWSGVPYAGDSHSLALQPKWWNSTAHCSLQLMVVPAGTPPFLSTIPAGPVFTATYAAPASGVPAAADLSGGSSTGGTTTVVSGVSSHSLSAGKKAAAVLLPLLFVLLLVLAYLKVSRAKGAAKRSAWSEKLDKRMSTISADWKSITPGGAKEAVRQSIAHSRNSIFAFGAITPGAVEGEPVVMGEKPRGSIEISEKDLPRTSLGSGVGVGVGARRPRTHATPPERTSRAVSFADAAHPRPSVGSASVYSRGSRAFHTASTYNDFVEGEAPPVPALPSPSRISAFGDRGVSTYSATAPSTYSGNSNYAASAGHGQSVYANASAWSSGERVEGVDGGYGAQSVSPTGRVHTINYPDMSSGNNEFDAAYDANAGSYFSPTTPTPHSGFPSPGAAPVYSYSTSPVVGAYEPSADSAYAVNTFGAPAPLYSGYASSGSESGGVSAFTSPRQTAGPSEGDHDIRVLRLFRRSSFVRLGDFVISFDSETPSSGRRVFTAGPASLRFSCTFCFLGGTKTATALRPSVVPAGDAGLLTLTPDDIRRRMTRSGSHSSSANSANRNSGFVGGNGEMDEVFGALSSGANERRRLWSSGVDIACETDDVVVVVVHRVGRVRGADSGVDVGGAGGGPRRRVGVHGREDGDVDGGARACRREVVLALASTAMVVRAGRRGRSWCACGVRRFLGDGGGGARAQDGDAVWCDIVEAGSKPFGRWRGARGRPRYDVVVEAVWEMEVVARAGDGDVDVDFACGVILAMQAVARLFGIPAARGCDEDEDGDVCRRLLRARAIEALSAVSMSTRADDEAGTLPEDLVAPLVLCRRYPRTRSFFLPDFCVVTSLSGRVRPLAPIETLVVLAHVGSGDDGLGLRIPVLVRPVCMSELPLYPSLLPLFPTINTLILTSLSSPVMRTGADDADSEGGDYLFAPPVAETVFAYPGTPAASSFNSTPNATAPASPFAMPMSAPTMSPDAMLRAYATKKKHTSSSTKHTSGAEVVPTLKNTGMRVLYKQPEEEAAGSASGSESGEVLGGAAPLIRAGPGARLSR
ncbi:hypothetical protein B0H16DRAFT_1475884 [Mycena metata]|uniref:Uncharacterized protein n=1 Tax=Mycena metata TaxID=1033252 RepID=A0AAD7HDA1_9AGAR|nr:hypothetical protein B0H16DRAFT_1475884 [Mycena metata]